MLFEALFDLKINLERRDVIQVGKVKNIEDLAAAFGCQVESFLPSPYLGLPLSGSF